MTRTLWLAIILVLFAQIASARMQSDSTYGDGTYTMTAYSIRGRTASGEQAQRRLVAADPAVLPLGSRIRISNAGPYSGEYKVGDTGAKIRGRRLDVHIANKAEAKEFGRKRVRVKVIKLARPTK